MEDVSKHPGNYFEKVKRRERKKRKSRAEREERRWLDKRNKRRLLGKEAQTEINADKVKKKKGKIKENK